MVMKASFLALFTSLLVNTSLGLRSPTPILRKEVSVSKSALFGHGIDRRATITGGATAAISFLLGNPSAAFAERATYLTEPTDEFKESERQRMEFRRAQFAIKQKFTDLFAHFTDDSTEDDLVKDLQSLKKLIASTGGMPQGYKRDDLVKIIRAKKAKGFWPTAAEYAYQSVIREIDYQQSPNKDKDIANPL
mmetsp:Transcript_65827/g.77349  ORF Transcript_65827/g.77349 Transcript_65827/m.77349 type:complete len:192 (+) Transcript_65827:37-612(+)